MSYHDCLHWGSTMLILWVQMKKLFRWLNIYGIQANRFCRIRCAHPKKTDWPSAGINKVHKNVFKKTYCNTVAPLYEFHCVDKLIQWRFEPTGSSSDWFLHKGKAFKYQSSFIHTSGQLGRALHPRIPRQNFHKWCRGVTPRSVPTWRWWLP